MVHAQGQRGTGFAAAAQIIEKARIVRGETAELGARHLLLGQEFFDLLISMAACLRNDPGKDSSYSAVEILHI